MLVSFEHKFIFLANLKTASSAIEAALRARCQIVLDRSEWGKHGSLSSVERGYPGLFEAVPRERFVVFGVMRDPIDWMSSLYRSHKSVQFEGHPLETSGMSFGTFLKKWCQQNDAQVRDQHSLFENMKGEFQADYIIRYDHLDEDFGRLMEHLDIAGCALNHENVSVDPPALDVITRKDAAAIRKRYRIDRQILKAYGGELRRGMDIEVDRSVSDSAEEEEFDSEHHEKIRRERFAMRSVTRDDVVWAFRMLLGRDPESEDTIASHLQCRNREELRLRIMASSEFAGLIA